MLICCLLCYLAYVICIYTQHHCNKISNLKKNQHENITGAAAPGFISLIPAPSVPLLISTEPVELFCRASNISSTDPFCFVKQKTGSG